MALKIGKDIIKYIPILAAIYAFYEYYAARGLDGIRADLEAITVEGIKAKAAQIITGIAAFIVGDIIASQFVKNQYLKIVIRTIAYYIGAKQLAGALRQGAQASSGGGRYRSVNPARTTNGIIKTGAY